MIVNNQIVSDIICNNKKCTYLNDDYVLLYKKMEVEDELLSKYISLINIAHDKKIHIPKVLDYKLLFRKENRSMGLFLEERAKGTVLNVRGMVLNTNKDYDFNQVIYRVRVYLIELEKRANASQEMYDKFLFDYISLTEFGLKPDPNSLNYLFDSKVGFTIIDPYMDSSKLDFSSLFRFIMNAVYGVSRPTIWIKKDKKLGFYDLPMDLKKQLEEYSVLVNQKICLAFQKRGYDLDDIYTQLAYNKRRFYAEKDSLEIDDLVSKLKNQFYDMELESKSI